MKHNIIKIREARGKLQIFVSKDTSDRERDNLGPISTGVYYCPTDIPIVKGIADLKKKLISDRTKVIQTLLSEIKDISEL